MILQGKEGLYPLTRLCWIIQRKRINNKGDLGEIFATFRMIKVVDVQDTTAAEGAVASWLVRSSPGRAARVRALARVTALYSWARHFTLTGSLSPLRWTSIPSSGGGGGGRNTPGRFMLQKPGWAPAWWATWPICRLYLYTSAKSL